MADKIVQLIDKDENNIFPVAGSMAGNSIETGMIQDEAITTAKIDDGAVTKDKIDWSDIKYKAGDTLKIAQTMTGQVRNLANTNDIGYFTVVLPFEIADGVSVSVSEFEIDEIENIGYDSSGNVIGVKDSNNNFVTRTQEHMTATATVSDYSRHTINLIFGVKPDYHWDGATSYNAVQFRNTLMTLVFS